MSGLELKSYQLDALDALADWLLETASNGDPDTAFYKQTHRPYRAVEGLNGVPYACLRVPTGGGKTIIAAHSIARAADALLATDSPCVIWLAPSDPIVSQTYAALRDPTHPYRAALAERFGSNVEVLDIKEALYAKRPTYDGNVVVIVATIQSFRQEETDQLNVYKDNGELMDHFSGLDAGALARLEASNGGQLIRSLANALKLRRPMVIVDEAHNARTPLSFVTLARLEPSLIVELTATPAPDSNILFSVSAAALKDAQMIKLPIILKVDPDPAEALRLAKARLEELHQAALAEPTHGQRKLRPVMLIQAQRKTGIEPLTPQRVKEVLLNDFQVPEQQIKIATGSEWELEGIDLGDPNEPSRFIITVQALKEGWDCPNAYVLCTLAHSSSSTAVEQILGRILRLPDAREKKDHRLNQAYAFATSTSFRDTANALAEALVSNGFEKLEAEKLIRAEASLPLRTGVLASDAVEAGVDLTPYSSIVAAETLGRVTLDAETRQFSATEITAADEARLRLVMPPLLQPALENLLAKNEARTAAKLLPPSVPQSKELPPFAVPQLCVRVGEQLEIFGPDHFLDRPWSLEKCDAARIVERFAPPTADNTEAVIDLAKSEKIKVNFVQQMQADLELEVDKRDWPFPRLVRWFDQRLSAVKGNDVTQASAQQFIRAGLQALMDERALSINDLRSLRFRLIEPFARLIRDYRDDREKEAFERTLFGDMRFDHTENMSVVFDPSRYFPPKPYTGKLGFTRHLAPDVIGDMNGEEEACAFKIDQHNGVVQWVRNIERQTSSFRLRISNQWFYPDFVAQMSDGSYVVVEYKGAGTEGPADRTDEKDAVGKLWAKTTSNRFVMVKDKDWNKLQAALGA